MHFGQKNTHRFCIGFWILRKWSSDRLQTHAAFFRVLKNLGNETRGHFDTLKKFRLCWNLIQSLNIFLFCDFKIAAGILLYRSNGKQLRADVSLVYKTRNQVVHLVVTDWYSSCSLGVKNESISIFFQRFFWTARAPCAARKTIEKILKVFLPTSSELGVVEDGNPKGNISVSDPRFRDKNIQKKMLGLQITPIGFLRPGKVPNSFWDLLLSG